ncbi:MAG: hypothetical protein JXB88_22350 [Spirochaetales bacterium]|nr:hypothetical protein [Spirochaetales bacterium]
MTACISFTYENLDIVILVDNLFNTHVFYKKYDLGVVLDNPAVLFDSNNDSLDHIGVIPMDVSLVCSTTFKNNSSILPEIELGYGFSHIIDFWTNQYTSLMDCIYLKQRMQFFPFTSLLMSLYKGSFYCTLLCSFTRFSLDSDYFRNQLL